MIRIDINPQTFLDKVISGEIEGASIKQVSIYTIGFSNDGKVYITHG